MQDTNNQNNANNINTNPLYPTPEMPNNPPVDVQLNQPTVVSPTQPTGELFEPQMLQTEASYVTQNAQNIPNDTSISPEAPLGEPQYASPKKPKKLFIVILIILCLGFVGGGVAALVIMANTGEITETGDNTKEDEISDKKEQDEPEEKEDERTKFENLSKEEAISFLQSVTLPENFVGEEILNGSIINDNTIVSDLDLIYSYDNLEELKQTAAEKMNISEDEFQITEYDYYAIVKPNRVTPDLKKCDHGFSDDCDSLLSFKSEYLNYYQKVEKDNNMISMNDVMIMNTEDPEAVNYILRVISYYGRTGLNALNRNIYSYNFEEDEDSYILRVDYVGAGANMEMIQNNQIQGYSQLAINLYHKRYAVKKVDGTIYNVPTETGTMDYIKSIPITSAEYDSLPGYGA